MKFASFMLQQVREELSLNPLSTEIPFNEGELLEQNKGFIFDSFKLAQIDIIERSVEGNVKIEDSKMQREFAVPARPSAYFY